MTKLQELLQEFADQKSDGLEVREYCGRGMYGKLCLAITGNIHTCRRAVAYAISALHQDLIAQYEEEVERFDRNASDMPAFEPEIDFEAFVQKVLDFRQDQMGHDVVFYWQDMEYVESSDEDG